MNMKQLVLAMAIVGLSSYAMADTVGINYSLTDPVNGNTQTNTFEVQGSKDYNKFVDITLKGVLKNQHSNPGYGTGVELGSKIRLASRDSNFIPWIQPAITYTSPESSTDNHLGYVVDAGVDLKAGKWVLTPQVSYADSFENSNSVQQTAGAKVSYKVSDQWSVDARYRREFNEDTTDADRVYAGVTYYF